MTGEGASFLPHLSSTFAWNLSAYCTLGAAESMVSVGVLSARHVLSPRHARATDRSSDHPATFPRRAVFVYKTLPRP